MPKKKPGRATDKHPPQRGMDDPVASGLYHELQREDNNLILAEGRLNQARAEFEVASRKYAAVREVAVHALGFSPYTGEWLEKFRSLGKFRFIHMSPGDAVVAALKEMNVPVTLDQLIAVLESGGAGHEHRRTIPARVVNAALRRTAGVKKPTKGTYQYVGDEADYDSELSQLLLEDIGEDDIAE